MSVDEVLQHVSELGCRLVTVTGGEPLLQDAVYLLVDELVSAGCQVLVETNGSLPIGGLNKDAVRILDLKCPDSGMCDKMDLGNISQLRKVDEVKFVLSTRRDYDWAKSVILQYQLDEKVTVLMSAAWERLKSSELADWMISDGVNARLQPQLHKLIGKR
jgi:7-carboxy-7-deazaguanine synthase